MLVFTLKGLGSGLLFLLFVTFGTPVILYLFLKEFKQIRFGLRFMLTLIILIIAVLAILYKTNDTIEIITIVDLILVVVIIIMRARRI